MLKIIPIFPSFKKDKQTSTISSPTQPTQHQSIFRPLVHSDNDRLLKLSTPKKNIYLIEGAIHKNSYNDNYQTLMTKSLFIQTNSINHQKENILHPLNTTFTKQSYGKSQFHTEEQQTPNKTSPSFRIKKHLQTLNYFSSSFQQTRQLKQQKKNLSYIQGLNSSNLSNIYSSLYNDYQNCPFNETQTVEPLVKDLVINVMREQKEKDDGLMKKERKQFQMKELQFERNLRKEIKSLTRDTDNILSREFRDVNLINQR